MPETQGQILRKCVAHALHVVDHRGHHAPGRMVLEKADGLADDLCVNMIPEIGDARDSRVLHQQVAGKFRYALPDENNQNGDGKNSSDTVNAGREKRVQVNRRVREGILKQEEPVIGSAGFQHAVKNRRNEQRDQAFAEPDQGKAHDARDKPKLIRLDVVQ